MGVESSLKSRYQPRREMYDRDRMPEGLDTEIWHLTLYFEQCGERYGHSAAGRPVTYTELSYRVSASGIRNTDIHWISVVQKMMVYFWDYEADPDKPSYAANNFCNADMFRNIYTIVKQQMRRDDLLLHGRRIVQRRSTAVPEARRTPDKKAVMSIADRTYTEEELQDKMRAFRERSEFRQGNDN
jgi:hypothetical protein